MTLLYLISGSAFYWLAYRNAPVQEELDATHPVKQEAEIVHLFPNETELRAA
ncbi:MAG: hypothetical protein J0H02_03085 [Armatimonadetes bacterium]|nr:hypothetical protein [Armatimonadota bacterium]